MIANNEFLEYATFGGNTYGTRFVYSSVLKSVHFKQKGCRRCRKTRSNLCAGSGAPGSSIDQGQPSSGQVHSDSATFHRSFGGEIETSRVGDRGESQEETFACRGRSRSGCVFSLLNVNEYLFSKEGSFPLRPRHRKRRSREGLQRVFSRTT